MARTGQAMRILLVNPPIGARTIGLKYVAKVEPLGLEILGAAVPGHEVELLDMEMDTDLDGTLRRFRPDIVGVSAQVVQTYTARRVLKRVKEHQPDTLTLVGGHHATLCPDDFNVPSIDAIVLGEGVPAFREIVDHWGRGESLEGIAGLALPRDRQLRFSRPRPVPATLDHQPLPDRSLTAKYRFRYFFLFESPVALVQTSMGCSYGCTFCSCQKFSQRRFVPRSPELIVEDLSRTEEEFVIFADDHSFIDPKRMARLHDLIVERGVRKRYFAYSRPDSVVENPELFRAWRRIGLELVMTGLEALDDGTLHTLEKRAQAELNERAIRILERCGIGVSAGFVVMPDFTEADFERIDDYLRTRPNIVLAELTPLTPLPGTDLHAAERGRVRTQHRELYDLAHYVVPTRLPERELYRLMRRSYRRILWRAVARLGLYRPRYALKRHFPRLAAGAVRDMLMMARAHRSSGAVAPFEDL